MEKEASSEGMPIDSSPCAVPFRLSAALHGFVGETNVDKSFGIRVLAFAGRGNPLGSAAGGVKIVLHRK